MHTRTQCNLVQARLSAISHVASATTWIRSVLAAIPPTLAMYTHHMMQELTRASLAGRRLVVKTCTTVQQHDMNQRRHARLPILPLARGVTCPWDTPQWRE
ncbi:hypothetical protein GF325_01595 [Candidatus Bathyarchaeota archaeon]|nr:hypothetical protein [Candidatus Bathyarchaeota archaeon]